MYNTLKGKIKIYCAIHHRANLTRTFKTEYQPSTSGTIEQEILKQVPCSFLSGRREKGGHYLPCPHFDVKIIQRSKRQSAVASAAYQSGERLFSEYDQNQSIIMTLYIDTIAWLTQDIVLNCFCNWFLCVFPLWDTDLVSVPRIEKSALHTQSRLYLCQ